MRDILVSVDPGVREAGLAVFEDGVLKSAVPVYYDNGIGPAQIVGMARALSDTCPVGTSRFVVERMNFRAGRSDAATDLMDVMAVVGATLAEMAAWEKIILCEFAEPAVWTSGRPKAVNHKRIRSRLSEEESAVLEAALVRCPKKNHKEVLDAVGIGLYALQRL